MSFTLKYVWNMSKRIFIQGRHITIQNTPYIFSQANNLEAIWAQALEKWSNSDITWCFENLLFLHFPLFSRLMYQYSWYFKQFWSFSIKLMNYLLSIYPKSPKKHRLNTHLSLYFGKQLTHYTGFFLYKKLRIRVSPAVSQNFAPFRRLKVLKVS